MKNDVVGRRVGLMMVGRKIKTVQMIISGGGGGVERRRPGCIQILKTRIVDRRTSVEKLVIVTMSGGGKGGGGGQLGCCMQTIQVQTRE